MLLKLARIFARTYSPLRRIASSLETLAELYELDLRDRGVIRFKRSAESDDDKIDIGYEVVPYPPEHPDYNPDLLSPY